MRRNKIISAIGVLLSFSVSMNAFAFEPQKVLNEDSIFLDKNSTSSTYIVKLSEKPVYDAEELNKSFSLSADEINSRTAKIHSEQNNFKNAVNRSFQGVEVIFSYDQIYNGLAINATPNQIEKIKALPSVENVYKCDGYFLKPNEEISTQDNAEQYQIAEDINVKAMYDDMSDGNNHGEGNLIAIIDSGFDVNHEVFNLSDISKAKLKTKADIADFINKDLSIGKVSANQIYKNSKIPFAYDYADLDADVYDGTQAHGNHVSGIASGNGDKLRGISPESQLILMKVANDDEDRIELSPVLAALNDAVKMGVDCVNMSLGAAYLNGSKNDPYWEAIDNLKSTKTELFVSAGNEGFGWGKSNSAYPEEVDYDTGGIPAGVADCNAVANAIGNQAYTRGNKMYDNLGNGYFFLEDGGSNFVSDLLGTQEFVVAGYGTDAELDKLDISGKLVIVKKGSPDGSENTSKDKRKAIQARGGVGMLMQCPEFNTLYNSEGFPVGIIFIDTYEALEKMGSGTLTITDEEENHYYNFGINYTSSYVMNEYLNKTVSISAPGTLVYSSTLDDKYGRMTGTSMASPTACGAYALAKSWFTEKFADYSEALVNPSDLKKRVFTMMQNTADPIVNSENDSLYTPRVQGAGYINLEDMINSKVIVYDPKTNGGIAYIGSTSENSFTFNVNIENLSNDEITYDKITAKSIIDDVREGYIVGSKEYMAEFEIPNAITVSANSTESFEVTVSITNEQRAELDSVFTNGFFLDGYLFLNNDDNSLEEITYPFTSFVGDWSKAPIFDKSYFEEDSLYGGSYFALADTEDYLGFCVGNQIPTDEIDIDKLYLSTRGNIITDREFSPFFVTSILRPIDSFKILIDGDETRHYTHMENYITAVFDLTDDLKGLNEGKHSFEINADNDNGCSDSISYDFYIDNTNPKITDIGFVNGKITMTIEENMGINAVYCQTGDDVNYPVRHTFATVTKGDGNTYTAVFDEMPETDTNLFDIGVLDYAFNEDYVRYSPSQSLIAYDKGYEELLNGYRFLYKIANSKFENTSFVPIFALYDENGKMTDIKSYNNATFAVGQEQYLLINLPTQTDIKSGFKRCLYLWQSKDDLVPLAPKLETEFE